MRIRSFSLPVLPNSCWWGGLIFGVILRLGYAWLLGDQWLAGDGGEYYEDALRWGRGEFPPPFWPPGLSWYLAGWFQLMGDGTVSAAAGMLLWYVALGVCWHWAAKKHLSLQIAIWGQGLLAVYPTLIHHSVVPLSQLPVAVALLICWWAYLAIKQSEKLSILWLSIMGLSLLVAVMIRPASLVIAPLCFWLSFRALPATSRRWLSIPILILLLGIGSWQGLLWQQTGRWIWINEGNSMNVWIGNNAWTPDYRTWWLGSHDEGENPVFRGFYEQRAEIRALPAAQHASAFLQAAIEHIQQHPSQFLWRTANRIRTFLVIDTYAAGTWKNSHPGLGILCLLVDAVVWILIMAGILWGGASSNQSLWLLGGICLLYALPYFFTFSHPTYRLAVFPLFLWLAGSRTKSRHTSGSNRRITMVWMTIFLLLQVEWVLRLLFLET